MTRPVATSIAGSDTGAGAGIQRDLRTFASLEVQGLCVLTAVTSQDSVAVRDVYCLPPEVVERQLDVVSRGFSVNAWKIGMLGSFEVAEVVAEYFVSHPPRNLVIDPVLVSSSGTELLDDVGRRCLVEKTLLAGDADNAEHGRGGDVIGL